MDKKKHLILLLIIAILFICPVNSKALMISDSINNITNNVYVLEGDVTLDDYNHQQDCDGSSNSLLGDPNDENSVAWLLQHILDFIKIVGPILVVVLSSIDFTRVIVKSDDEAMAKAQKKLGLRLILAILLFMIPVLVETILNIFAFSSGTCGLH